jgi:tRNA G26 N,N-dimethylase Trm1
MYALQMTVFYNSNEDLGRDLAVPITTAVVILALAVRVLRRQLAA